MKTETKFGKYLYYLNKKIRITIDGLKYKSIIGRYKGPKVLANSVPKAGTNLLISLIKEFEILRHYGKKTFRELLFDSEQEMVQQVKNIKKGQYVPSHLPYYPKVDKAIKAGNIKGILLVRDPRDVLFSHLKYVTRLDKSHKTHKYFNLTLENDYQRIKVLLKGENDVVEALPNVYRNYLKWTKSKEFILLKFEDLIGPKGGGSKNAQERSVRDIALHLEIELDERKVEKIAKNIYSRRSPTFNKGKINSWMNKINDKEKKVIKEHISELLIELGYEEDDEW